MGARRWGEVTGAGACRSVRARRMGERHGALRGEAVQGAPPLPPAPPQPPSSPTPVPPPVQYIEGRGRLVDAHTVQVGDRTVTARNILIATGARAFVPPFEGAELCMISDNALEVAEVGGGRGPLSGWGGWVGACTGVGVWIRCS